MLTVKGFDVDVRTDDDGALVVLIRQVDGERPLRVQVGQYTVYDGRGAPDDDDVLDGVSRGLLA